jgi:hypothetical protein
MLAGRHTVTFMLHAHLTIEFQADSLGPHEVYVERLILPAWFASNAREASDKLLILIATQSYFELPQLGADHPVPLNAETVRAIAVWED